MQVWYSEPHPFLYCWSAETVPESTVCKIRVHATGDQADQSAETVPESTIHGISRSEFNHRWSDL